MKIYNKIFKRYKFLISNLFLFSLLSGGDPINIDGIFDDWASVPTAYIDTENDAFDSDFYKLKITYDNEFIFIYFSFYYGEFLLQNWNNFHLYIDADNDSSTGLNIQGIGAELDWNFGNRSGYKYVNNQQFELYQNDLTLRIAPTITSAEFEIAIARESSVLTLNDLQTLNVGRVILTEMVGEGDILPNESGGVSFTIGEDFISNPEPIDLEKLNLNDIRLISYNTWNEGILDNERQIYFQRILQALNPDIIALQEHGDWEYIEYIIQSWFPEESWNASWTYGDLVVLSRFTILNDSNMSSGRTMAVLLDTEAELGKNLLIFNSHLSCCDNNEDRQDQVDQFTQEWREWVLNETGPFNIDYGTPFIHVGDFNFVGYKQQVETILLGDIENEYEYGDDFFPDWDSSPVIDLSPRHTHKRMGYTWRKDVSSFNPGKLDYIFFSDATIDTGRNYILNTLAMDDLVLDQYLLERNDTENASDHLPLIFDILINESVGNSYDDISPNSFKLFSNYPNPFNSETKIKFFLSGSFILSVKIVDIKGSLIKTIYSGKKDRGLHYLKWDGTDMNGFSLGSGMYLIFIELRDKIITQKIILLK